MDQFKDAQENSRALKAFSKARKLTLVETGIGYVILEYVSALAGTRKRYDSRDPVPVELIDFVNGYQGVPIEGTSTSYV